MSCHPGVSDSGCHQSSFVVLRAFLVTWWGLCYWLVWGSGRGSRDTELVIWGIRGVIDVET